MTMRPLAPIRIFGIAACCFAVSVGCSASPNKVAGPYDLVILNGRVIDAESNTDRIMNVASGRDDKLAIRV